MSLMTKFLHQKAKVQLMERDSSGKPVLDDYGEPLYENRLRNVKCRREASTKDVLTISGSAKQSCTVYYIDTTVQIAIGDKIDGKPVLTVQEYINSAGYNEGYEVLV